MKIGVLYSRKRVEEKLITAVLDERGLDWERVDPREVAFVVGAAGPYKFDVVLERCLSYTNAYYLSRWFEGQGVPFVSPHQTIATCGDKYLTTQALTQAGIPSPKTMLALSTESALEAIEAMGYPVVIKPLFGSWGRLLARVNDRDAAEAILEHKTTLGGYQHNTIYIQEYIDKPGRDIRTMVVGDKVIYAIYRQSEHWITNTARGGDPQLCPMTDDIINWSVAAAKAVGGGIVSVDLMETAGGEIVVNEVNQTPEFHGARTAVDVDIAGAIVDYLINVAESKEIL